MRVQNEFLGRTLIEVFVSWWRLVERDYSDVDAPGRVEFVVDHRVHELAVVSHDRTLPRHESVGFSPAQSNPYAEVSGLRVLVYAARIVGHIETGNADFPTRLRHGHQRIQYCRRRFYPRLFSMPVRFKTDAIDGAFDFGNSDDLLDLLAQRRILAQIDDLASIALGLLEAFRNHVA